MGRLRILKAGSCPGHLSQHAASLFVSLTLLHRCLAWQLITRGGAGVASATCCIFLLFFFFVGTMMLPWCASATFCAVVHSAAPLLDMAVHSKAWSRLSLRNMLHLFSFLSASCFFHGVPLQHFVL